ARLMAVCRKRNHMRNPHRTTHRGMIPELESSRVIPHQPLGYTAGLLGRLSFDMDEKCRVDKVIRVLYREQTNSGTNCRARTHCRREPDLVQTIIDAHPDARAYLEHLFQKITEERKRQEPVRDAASEGRFARRTFPVYVNPLMVFGGVRKFLDAILRHREPLG